VVSTTVDAAAESVTLDALGRMTATSNGLGSFGYSYVNQTSRPNVMTYPNGQTTTYSYWPNVAVAGTGNGDERLQTIWHKVSGGATLAKHDYGYNAAGDIVSWTQQTDVNPAAAYGFGYDGASELLTATRTDAGSGAVQKQYTYGYDRAGNRTMEQIDAAVASATCNNLNELTGRTGAGPMSFEGTVDKPAVVTVGGNLASIDANRHFKATANVSPGQPVEIKATDDSGNVATKQVTVAAGSPPQTLTYDLNGNLTGDGSRTFTWDAENRLTSVTVDGQTYAWTYNGAGQRVAEKLNGTLTKQWVWDDKTPKVELNTSNTVTKRFYPQGAINYQPSTINLFYTRDHLGSIREVTDSTGTLLARYDYDPYGRRTKVSGTFDADFGFTGHYVHLATGLHLAYYRAYDADLARWLNRDPVDGVEIREGRMSIPTFKTGRSAGLIRRAVARWSLCPLSLSPLL